MSLRLPAPGTVAVASLLGLVLAVVLLVASPSPPPATRAQDPTPAADTKGPPAFPTAQGFGRDSVGGRGGRVIPVTSLADRGPGTLRAALEASGRRIVVFRVAGTITLADRIVLARPYVTIAGQTAPGDGIQVRNDPDSDSEALRIQTHDVVIRHLRVRPGPTSEPSCCSGAVTILGGAHDVILDHVSLTWGVDENLSSGDGAHDYTIQWSIIAQGLDDATHEEGSHSRGVLLGSWTEDHRPRAHRDVSLHHNLFAHNDRRSPRVSNAGRTVVANNVIYNWRDAGIQVSDESGVRMAVAVVGNWLDAGRDSGNGVPMELLQSNSNTPGFELFLDDNVVAEGHVDLASVMRPEEQLWFVGAPTFQWPPIDVTSAASARRQVLERAGASRPVRDRVDAGIVESVRSGTGMLIDDPGQVGGWPDLTDGAPYPDADGDGMGNQWERRHGLDPTDPADGARSSPRGDTWVEVFLSELAGDPPLSGAGAQAAAPSVP